MRTLEAIYHFDLQRNGLQCGCPSEILLNIALTRKISRHQNFTKRIKGQKQFKKRI